MNTGGFSKKNFSSIKDVLSIFDQTSETSFWGRLLPNKVTLNERVALMGLSALTLRADAQGFHEDLSEFGLQPDEIGVLVRMARAEQQEGILVGNLIALPIHLRDAFAIGLIGQAVVLDLVDRQAAGSLTRSEQRIILQVLCGQQLRKAADQDGVSYETKRSQLRAATSKLGFSRQTDVTQSFLLNLVSRLVDDSVEPQSDRFLRTYVTRFLPADNVRLHTVLDDNQHRHHILDLGPLTGQKILAVHPHVPPRLGATEINILVDHDLRIIWPLRPGSMSGTDPGLPESVHRRRSVSGLLTAWRTMFDGPAPLVAMVDGTNYAVSFLSEHPEAVRRAIFVGFTGVTPGENLIAGKIRRGIVRLAARHPTLLSKAFEHYTETMKDMDKLQNAVERMFRGCPADLAVIRSEFSGPDRGVDFQSRVLGSIGTIRQDYTIQAIDSTGLLRRTNVPLTFIHGALDLVQPLAQVEALSDELGNADLQVLPDCGQLIYDTHFPKSVAAIRQTIDRS